MGENSAVSGAIRQASAGRAMIGVERVTKTFGEGERAVVALDAVSLAIGENEFFTLLGPSGCGKTTLLRLIAGFELPTRGGILLDGQEIGHLPPYRRAVNTVFQNYALFPHMTVAENIAFGLAMLGRSPAEREATVRRMLALVRMEAFAGRRTDQLSGGQQQRVALARALAPHPKVLLLDEPLSALDLKLRREMQIELKRLQHETGITFVFVTHDQEEALAMSDRIAVMDGGRVLQTGTPREIYDRPARRFVADFIGSINILEAEATAGGDGRDSLRLGNGVLAESRTTAGGLPPGRVNLAIRPEHIRLCGAEDAARTLTGTVAEVVYFGSGSRLHVAVEGLGTLIARSERGDSAIGERVGLVLPPERLQVLAD